MEIFLAACNDWMGVWRVGNASRTWPAPAGLRRARREVVNDILERTGKDRLYAPTVRRYPEDWLRKEKGTISENAYGKKELVVRLFLEALDGRETLPIEDVTEAEIVSFREKPLADSRRARTVNTMVRDLLSNALRDAQKTGLIRLNPAAALPAWDPVP